MNVENPSAASINSTIVRLADAARLGLLRTYFGFTSRLHPGLARHHAEKLFTTPPRPAGSWRSPGLAHRETLATPGGGLALWRAGPNQAPAVLLVHGWGGAGHQLGAFVEPLLAQGFRVVWFDHPGHGESGRRAVGLPELVRAIHAIDGAAGPFDAAIGHSLGASAATLALRGGLRLQRVALIGAPASMAEHLLEFARLIGITPAIRDAMRRRIENRYGVSIEEIDRIAELSRLTLPALFVHDLGDRQVPFSHALRLAGRMPGARLIRTYGLGHFRIVRDPDVVHAIVGFVTDRDATLPTELPALPNPAPLY